jgi:hypothetical protein
VKHDDVTRAQKLRGLLERLKQGKKVQNRDLQTWLGADGYSGYVDTWAAQKAVRLELASKPDAIVEYEARLKKANFTYNRAEYYSRTGKRATAKRLFGQADTQYERLLERLQEIVAADPSLAAWFDRDTTWDRAANLSLCPSGVPYVVTSKSLQNEARGGGLQVAKMDKQAVKIWVIEQELAELQMRVDGVDMNALLAKRRKLDIAAVHPERDSD